MARSGAPRPGDGGGSVFWPPALAGPPRAACRGVSASRGRAWPAVFAGGFAGACVARVYWRARGAR
eukprot:5654670-Lingulodinium_polyedra.AAC.1